MKYHKTELTKMAKELFYKALDHQLCCNDVNCEFYWITANLIRLNPKEIEATLIQIKKWQFARSN